MSKYDFLLSEEPDVESTLLPYSEWSEENEIPDELQSRKEYSNYLRSSYIDAGSYNKSVEADIRDGLQTSLVKSGVIQEDDEEAKRSLFVTPEASIDEKLEDSVNTLRSSDPDWKPIIDYFSFKKVIKEDPNAVESFKQSEDQYRLPAEEALSRKYNDVVRTKIRNNEIPFAKITNEKGETEFLTSDLATQIPLKDALAKSKRYGVDISDAYLAQEQLTTKEGSTLPTYKANRAIEAATMIETLSKEDEDVMASIDGYSRRLARKEYDTGDKVQEIFNEAFQPVVDFFGKVIGRGEEVEKRQKFDTKSSTVASSLFQTTAENIAKKLNSSGAITDGEAFTVEEVGTALNELGLRHATDKGYFQFHDGEDEIGKNIRNYGIGLPYASPLLMANKEKYDAALAARTDISDSTKQKMEFQRQSFLKKEFQQFNEKLQKSPNGEEWLNELQKGRANGIEDTEILGTYLSNPDNYNEFSERAKGIGMSIFDGVGQMVMALPAALEVDFAQDYLAKVAQQNSDRRELANMFGVDMGAVQDIGEAIAPMVADATATSLLAGATAPAAGLGGAAYLAAKQGARLTVKGMAKGITRNIFKPLAGETMEQSAQRLLTEGLIKQSVKDGGVNGAMAAIKGSSSQIASKLSLAPASFIPAANRSMGATYGTLFNEIRKDPNISREEAHDRALGASLTSGVITGLITAGFSGIGKGGFDTVFTRGLSYNQTKTLFGRLLNATDDLSSATVKSFKGSAKGSAEISEEAIKDVMKTSLKDTFKKYGYASIGKQISKEAYDEGVEEGLDTFINSFVEDAALNKNTPMLERANQTLHSFLVGAAMGSAVPAVKASVGSINREARNVAARNMELEAITNVTSALRDSGSPLSEQIVSTLLTGPVRRRQALADVLRQRAEVAAPPASVVSTLPPRIEKPTTPEGLVGVMESYRNVAPTEGFTAEQKQKSVEILDELDRFQKSQVATASTVEPEVALTGEEVTPVTPVGGTAGIGLPEELITKMDQFFDELDSSRKALTGTDTGIAPPAATKLTADDLRKSLSEIDPKEIENLIPVVRPEEVETTGQMDLGLYIQKDDATKEPLMVPFNTLSFGSGPKRVMEQLGLDFGDVVQSEVSDSASKPTIRERAELPTTAEDGGMVGPTLEQFVGDDDVKASEMAAFDGALRTGYPISFQVKARYGMPKRDVSEKTIGQKSYYRNRSDDLAKLIYTNFPVKKYVKPVNGSTYTSQRSITFFDPKSNKRVSKSVTGFLDENGNGLFDNDPVLVSEMIRDGVSVKVPYVFEQKINPSFVIRNRRVVDVLGPRPDGKAGLISMTTPIERSLTSEPDYKSLNDSSNLASLFLDDRDAQRVISSGAPVIDQSGKATNIGSMPTSVGEVLNNFNQFVSNAFLPQGEGVSREELTMRTAASNKVREVLRLRNGAELESGFFDTAVTALHTDYINLVNLFEIRSSLISSNIAVETPTGYKINPSKQKAAVNLFLARLKPENKTTIATRLSPFVKADEKQIREAPDKVILSFLDSQALNRTRFEGNTMPTLDQVASTIKGRYADQQQTREIEEKVKVTTSMDPVIMDQIPFEDISKEATYIGEPSVSGSESMSAAEVSSILKQAEFNAINAIEEDAGLRDALNDLLFQSIYKNPTTTQVARVTGMTTTDAFGTLANWISKGNFNDPEIISFEQSLRGGEFASGNDLRSALSLARISSRASTSEDPTKDDAFVASVRSEIGRSLGREVTVQHAKNFIRAIDKSMRKRMSRSHITQAQRGAANNLNTATVSKLGLVSNDPESVIKALKQISKSSTNKSHKLVADLLLEDEAFIKTIKFEIGEADISVAGEYNRLTDGSHSVFLNLDGYNGRGLENVLLEEYVHAFLSDVANKPKEFLKRNQAEAVGRLNGLMELVRKQADREGINDPSLMDGLANIDDFIANFLLSQNFQALVKTVQPPKGQRGFFTRIIDAIVGIFRKVNAKEKDLYSEALKDILDLSRSAMKIERNSSASLFASVAEDASDILNRAVAVREALPESVRARFVVAEEPAISTEQQLNNINQRFYTSVNQDLVRQQQSVTEESVPKSVTETDSDQVKRARSLMTLIRSIVPYEVKLNFLNPNEIAKIVAEGGEESRFIASATGDVVDIDMGRLMAYVEEMDNLTANMLVESVVMEELGHVASYNALPQSTIDEIANSFTQAELDAIADSYYPDDASRTGSKDRTKSEEVNASGVRVDLAEKRVLVEEYLRAHLQRVTGGFSTEENAAFLRTNPSLFKIMLRYIGGVFRRMAGTRTGNPMVDVALTRMLTELRGIKMGYRARPSRLQFDPNNPTASMEAFRMITGLDNLDQIEFDGFDEDFAEALYSQISLEDFKRIQKLGLPESQQPTGEITYDLDYDDFFSFINTKFADWSEFLNRISGDFEFDNEFVMGINAEDGLGYIEANLTSSEFEDYPEIRGDANEIEYLAVSEYLKRKMRRYVAQYTTARNIDGVFTEQLIDNLTSISIVDVVNFGMGPQLVTNENAPEELADVKVTFYADSKTDISSGPKDINISKLQEVLTQIDGLSIVSYNSFGQNSAYITASIKRGNKIYELKFDVGSGGSVSVGNLVPKKGIGTTGEETTGEVMSADSFGTELLLALVSNNHLIGARTIRTYAAGTATSVRYVSEMNAERARQAAARGEKFEPSFVYKGFKAWPKLGFDSLLTDYEIGEMADELYIYYGKTGSREKYIEDITRLAEDKDGIRSISQLVHLSDDPSYGYKLWSNGGMGKNMTFDLTAGSKSLQAFSNLIQRTVKIKGIVEEIKPLRQAYSRNLKSLSQSELSEQEKSDREKQIKDNYVQQLNKLGVDPDRLLTSLGSGTAFSGSSIKFDALLETLEMPMFEAGTYKAPDTGFLRAFMGELDPRITRLDDNRNAFMRAASLLVNRYKGTLDKLVEKRYGSVGNAPSELIAEAMGSTGVEVSEDVYDRIEDEHTTRLIDIRSNASLTQDERSAAIADSASLRDEAVSAARTAARDLAVKRKDAALTTLTTQAPEIAKHIVDLRDKLIDPISKKLKGLYGVTEELGVYMDSQLGLYMTRAYRMFNEVGFAERVKQDPLYKDVREKAMKFFDDQFVKLEKRRLEREGTLPAEAEQKAKDELINKRSSNGESYGQQALAAFIESYATKNDVGFGGAALGEGYRVMLNNLKNKKDIPPALRDVLGEYKNSEEGTNNLLRTFVTVSTMAANQSFLNHVRTLGERNGFIVTSEEYYANPSKYEGFVPFRSSKTAKFDPLMGTFAPKEMVEGFQKTFDSQSIRRNTSSTTNAVDQGMRVLNKATGYAMAAKTLGSVGFYFRNVISNMMFFGPAQGFARVDKMIKVAAEQSWKGLKDQNRIDEYIAELTAFDIVGNDVQASVIRDLLNGKVEPTGIMKQLEELMDKSQLSKGTAALKFVGDKASRLSAHADAVFKIAYFEFELGKLKEAQRSSNTGSVANMNEYQLKRMAAEKVLMTAQSASQAPPIVSDLTRSGLGLMFAPFLRFKMEVPRIIINTYKLAKKEMKDANPSIKRRGKIRFASMTGMLGVVSTTLPTALRVLASGIDDEEDEALRNSIPEYLRGNTFYYFGRGESLTSMNLTFINPFSLMADPTMRALEQISRGNFGKAASSFFGGMIFDSYLNDQIFAGAFGDLRKNINSTTGEPIWEEDIDGVFSTLMKGGGYLFDKAYSPRILSDAIKAYSAAGGDYTEFDDSPLGLMLSGVYPARIHDVDLNKQFNRYLREKKEQFDRITKAKYALYGEKPVSEDTIRNLYDDEVKNRKRLNQDLIKTIRGFEGLGLERAEIYRDMVARGGMSKRRAALLFNNMMDRPDLNKGFLQGLLEKEYGLERAKILIDQLDQYSRYMFVEE